MSQYADDTTLYIKQKHEYLAECLDTLEKFAQISGLRINVEKTKIIQIGGLRDKARIVEGVPIVTDPKEEDGSHRVAGCFNTCVATHIYFICIVFAYIMRIQPALRYEVIYVSMPMKLGGNRASGGLFCPGYPRI